MTNQPTDRPQRRLLSLAMALMLVFTVSATLWFRDDGYRRVNTVSEPGRERSGPPSTAMRWIDTHAHPFTTPGSPEGDCLTVECLTGMQVHLDGNNISAALLLPMPSANNNYPAEDDLVSAVADTASERYRFLLGGFSLNPKIQMTAGGAVSQAMRDSFAARADEIAALGAVGYGEFAALHFAMSEEHVFEEVSPDHPLFLLLAEKSAEHRLPIDLHMEAALRDRPVHADLQEASSLNPETIRANIGAFETLLNHAPGAKIVWVHIGWDNTGDMTVNLLRHLLTDHANLFLQVEISGHPVGIHEENAVVDSNGALRAEWLDLMQDFPDRFILGSDSFYRRPDLFDDHMGTLDAFVQALPEDIQAKVAYENAIKIYEAAT